MAVIDAVPGVEVFVCVDAQPVKEYEDADEVIDGPLASKTVVKYIEAISDTQFTIKVTVHPAFDEHRRTRDDLLTIAKVDGRWVDGRFRDCAINKRFTPWNMLVEGMVNNEHGRETSSAFTFTTVEIGLFANHIQNTEVLIDT